MSLFRACLAIFALGYTYMPEITLKKRDFIVRKIKLCTGMNLLCYSEQINKNLCMDIISLTLPL